MQYRCTVDEIMTDAVVNKIKAVTITKNINSPVFVAHTQVSFDDHQSLRANQ